MKDNDGPRKIAFVRQVGTRLSAYEHLLPEKFWTDAQHPGEGVSAVKALAKAAAAGQKIYTLTGQNLSALGQIQIDAAIRAEIQNALNAGKTVTVHEKPITVSGWTGTGYIIDDPATGAGAYKISGGANGGALFSAITTAIGILGIMVSLSPFVLILAILAGPAIALAITIFVVWSLVLYDIQQLDAGPARGIIANLAYGAFGIALGALTGSAWVALLSWVVFSVANYYISYIDWHRREHLYA